MFLALLLSAAVVTEPPGSPPNTDQVAVPNSAIPAELRPGERREKVICRDEVRTGTRFAKRTCLTLEDFKRRQEESRSGFAEMQRNHNIPPGCEQSGRTC